MAKLKLDFMQATLPKQYKKLITQDIVDEINMLVDDPEYGEHCRDSMITYTTVLDGKDKWNLRQYVDAVKFYSLTAAMNSQVDAYAKVFPNRLQARLDRGENKDDMRGEASRFNATGLVNVIRSQALVPLHLINQGNLQLGINTLVDICVKGRSEVAKVSAATALLKELRPPETQQVELQLGLSDDARAAQEKQTNQLLEIATNQRRLLEQGVPISEVQRIHVNVVEAELEEDENE